VYWRERPTVPETLKAHVAGVESRKPEKSGRPPCMVSEAAARCELEDLRAAINDHRGEVCSQIVAVRLFSRKSHHRH
jgi:hypothetical protein